MTQFENAVKKQEEIQNLKSVVKKQSHAIEQIKILFYDLGFDTQRMSGSGQVTYKQIENLLKTI